MRYLIDGASGDRRIVLRLTDDGPELASARVAIDIEWRDDRDGAPPPFLSLTIQGAEILARQLAELVELARATAPESVSS